MSGIDGVYLFYGKDCVIGGLVPAAYDWGLTRAFRVNGGGRSNELSLSPPSGNGTSRSKTAGRLEMSKYTAAYWKDRANEIRAIRDNMTGEVPRQIMAEIAGDFDRLYHWTLKNRQQAIEVLVSTPFSVATRDREPNAPPRPLGAKEQK
jgi:hypothetical protein